MATAASITTYSDREFLFRLQTLVIDGGTEVLRNIFDQRLQNQPLNVVLASERSTINRLRRQNTLTRVQYDSLYPSTGQLQTSSDLDITLIVCLLRNLPCLGCNQNYNWNVPPQTGDTSVEADVCRLRVFRNEIAHISSTTGFQQSSFEAKWREIETVLLRLDQNSPTPNFSQTIDSYKYGPMDPANEHKLKTTIEQWQERDRGLETDMQLIKKDFSDTKEDIKTIKKDFSDTKEDVKTMKKDFSDTREDIKTIKKDFSDTKEDVKSIKKEFSDTKEDVKSIKKDFSNTQEDVKTIKKEVIYLRQGMPSQEETEKAEEKAYVKMKSNLQDDLILFDMDQSIPLSPLMEEDQPLEIMLSKCKCVKDILDMSKMFKFIVSISGEFSFSCELMKIINEDEITQEYRRSLQDGYSHPLKDLQDKYISGCKEIPRENEVSLCLQDVFIDYSCWQEEYGENLKRLTTRNKQNIRSVYIDMSRIKDTFCDTGRKVIDYFALSDLKNIEKIHYRSTRDEDIDDVILPWLNSSVTSLYLSYDTFKLQRGCWSRSLSDKVTSLQKLEAIGICRFTMNHRELSLLLDFISQRDCLREIKLEWLECTDHGSSCTGLSLLWGHKPLRKLTLSGLELSQVIINMASLENCNLWGLPNEDLELEFVNCADNKLNKFICWTIKSSAAIDEIVRMLRESRHVRRVELRWIDLGRRNLTLSPDFVKIEYLCLHGVSMEGSACRALLGSVLELKQTVTVYIRDCTISPEEEFETLKGDIKTSQRVRRLKDEKGGFEFKVIKDGD